MTDWLTARPVAHRGLHDAGTGTIENMPAAFQAAVAGNYAIECDLQITADGEAMVHHDDGLGRLTEGDGALRDMTAAQLRQVAFKDTAERMIALGELSDLVAGRAPMFLEVKSRFDGEHRLVPRIADVLRSYTGPVAVMSFDPQQVEAVRTAAPGLPRGIVAESRYDHPEWAGLPDKLRRSLAYLLHGARSRPHFVAYHVKDLPALAPLAARHAFGLPLLTWTVRTAEDRERAARYADQIIFEGFRA